MEKYLLHMAAALLANAATPRPSNLPIDPTLSQDQTKSLIGQVCETHRVYYHWLNKTLTDASWPDPAVKGGAVLAPLVQSLQALVNQIPGAPGVVGSVPNLGELLNPTAPTSGS